MKTLTVQEYAKPVQEKREYAALPDSVLSLKLQLFLKLGLVLLLSLFLTKSLLMAQEVEEPRFSTLTVSEHYVETIRTSNEDGYVDYAVVPSKLYSNLAISGRIPSAEMDFSQIDESTPVSISVGGFSFDGILEEAIGGWQPTDKSAAFRLTISDYDTGDDVAVGKVTVTWGGEFVVYTVHVIAPEDFNMSTGGFLYEENDDFKTEITASASFGDYSVSGQNVYLTVNSRVSTRIIGSGDDAQEFELSAVHIRGAIDTSKPQPVFSEPVGEIVTSNLITLTGTVTDDAEVIEVNVKLDDGSIERAILDEDRWSLDDVALKPGKNTICVQAIDSNGNISAWESRKISYLLPLIVSTSGEGSVTKGFLGTTFREPGSLITLKAFHKAGHIFQNWSGSISATAASLTFEMKDGLTIQANFTPSPFPEVRGAYCGVVSGYGLSGSISLNVLSTGGATARLMIDGKKHSVIGVMGLDGRFNGTISRVGQSPLAVELSIDMTDGKGVLSGSVSDGLNTSEISGRRAMLAANGSVFVSGKYTVLLPAVENSGDQLRGDGYGLLAISKTGVVTLVGALGDGTPLSVGTVATQGGVLYIHSTLYSGKGMLLGELAFNSQPGIGDIHGELSWKKLKSLDGLFQPGFVTSINAVGSHYLAPAAGMLPVSVPVGAENLIKIEVGSGGLNAPIIKSAMLRANGTAVVAEVSSEKMKVGLTPSTGIIRGSFVNPSNGAIRAFKGVLLQSQNMGAGHFVGTHMTGYMNLTVGR